MVKRIIKTEDLLNSQIPSFISSDNNLFQEFLRAYYTSQSHSTGISDIVSKLSELKKIETYSSDVFYTSLDRNSCYLIDDITRFSDEIEVNSTEGFPEKYGLFQIDDEIISYTEKTSKAFKGCFRGFSGITEINDEPDTSGLVFTKTKSQSHESKSKVINLNLLFYSKLFEKFKSHYFPDFEGRELNSKVNPELILTRARDFYLSKGSDLSFKILFEILFGNKVEVIKPKNFLIKTEDKDVLVTKNVLVEPLNITINDLNLIGKSLYQNLYDGNVARASIYNLEFRPTDDMNLYEISLDEESFEYDFITTKKTYITQVINDGIIVDSTIGFPNIGRLYVKIKNIDNSYKYVTLNYSGKTINKFLNISNISLSDLQSLKEGDELIEDNLVNVDVDDNNTISFRLLNLIKEFNFSDSYSAKVNDLLFVTGFGENFNSRPEFNSWIYNYPTYHNVKTVENGIITLYDDIKFRVNEKINLIDLNGNSYLTFINEVLSENIIKVNIQNNLNTNIVKIKRVIETSSLNTNESVYIQNAYLDEDTKKVIISSSGLPIRTNLNNLNKYNFKLLGSESNGIFYTLNSNTLLKESHNLKSGDKIYLESTYSDVESDYYFIQVISKNSISLYNSTGDLASKYNKNLLVAEKIKPIFYDKDLKNINIGLIYLFGYEANTKGFSNQLLLKEFDVEGTLINNIKTFGKEIYNIKDAYNAFKLLD